MGYLFINIYMSNANLKSEKIECLVSVLPEKGIWT